MRHLWGAEMSMVFQNPLNSLNPLMKIGKQITESLKLHLDMDKQNAKATACSCCATCTSPSRRSASTSTRTSCPAACASG